MVSCRCGSIIAFATNLNNKKTTLWPGVLKHHTHLDIAADDKYLISGFPLTNKECRYLHNTKR